MKTVFETIKDRLPIAEVLATYISVEQSGTQYKAKCPFHNERSASFYISSDRGLYYCFGCGAKGDIFTFVEAFEGLDKKGALKLLAARAGVPLTHDHSAHSDTDMLYDILEKATSLYQATLKKNTLAQQYLFQRGVTPETIEHFQLGYAPDEWRTIENSCKNIQERNAALRAGLTKKTQQHAIDKTYDRFRTRIMFPLTDASGRIIGFSGRLFPDSKDSSNKSPKYLNSPETELFQKSKVLFGFDKAKPHIKKNNFAILVEGQMDLILSHQAGFRNTVATSGTAVSLDAAKDPFSNMSVLSRLTPHIFLAFDGDLPGQNAMDKAAIVTLSLGMNPKVVVLPHGTDPAEYIKEHGPDAWKGLLKQSKHFIEHHLSLLQAQALSPHLLVRSIKQKLFPFLSHIPSVMEKNLYIKMISDQTGMPVSTISEELSKVSVAMPVSQEVVSVVSKKNALTLYERLYALHVRYPTLAIEKIMVSLATFSIADTKFGAPEIAQEILEKSIIVVEQDYGTLTDTERENVARELCNKIIDQFLVSLRKEHLEKLKDAEREGDDITVDSLSIALQKINKYSHDRGGS